jgi:signal peptidase I
LGWLRQGLIALAFVLALAVSPFRPLKIQGRSMEPTLKNGETFLLDQLYWRTSPIRRGDIVVVRHNQEKWVKRLIGMPHDELQLTYSRPNWISRVVNVTADPSAREDGPFLRTRKVGDDEIFVIGDNLNWSSDSTNQEAGAFKLEDIVGVVRTFTFRRDFPFRTHL